ncbi:general stress protein [Aneurinibacillus migulanus]|uniref:Heat induced stress protein YflT n=1 Tax=Aneurinibacillus migulanus TaxID=47500 RepID=A0A0D1XBL3_ANEMI|nr:general stress protein [Aneurinibacillus migulanus]KIV51776.1 hypothetical protein TS65_24655 [Aneurinibacillus migulanus]KON97893.1 hypothetical protein AF333_23135 [Aneurinibacillus migulanus]MED0891133.1 general stress protein [Aneurinibacillus migulanus]MED1614179.1 general stress protein [Aneurinibacillus migulanus]SDH97422.1 Heat induced stress protein YflT [Aneurinibacillus migulanus]
MREPQTTARVYNDETKLQHDIQELRAYGYKQEDIYILAANTDKQRKLNEVNRTHNVEWLEVGLWDSMKNWLRSDEEKIGNQMEHLGVSEEDINELEKRLGNGEYVLVVRDTTRDSHHPFIDRAHNYNQDR